VQVLGVTEQAQRKQFVLRFLQARDPSHIGQLFFAKYSGRAAWVDQLDIDGGEALGFDAPVQSEEKLVYPPTQGGGGDVRLHR
jgi:hypothetical protein